MKPDNFDRGLRWGLVLLTALCLATGCHKHHAPAPTDAAQTETALHGAFDQATGQTKALAESAAAALQAQHTSEAFLRLNALCARTDLNPQQREAAVKAMVAVNGQLQQQAQRGDQGAANLLKAYRQSK